ncbi:hypothetical protein J2X46_003447 [Nocardioides sp. BE266]|uniref:hypothetical protein n=1 Tax=Nocardioides sp. BE266 TaxID=2817725 RepID=UPI0028672154|nr:hypothetical protein [Nocardioides sp. BE266]MDR7254454.1 hypothetical protein [Nocardioides sp. BE266]
MQLTILRRLVASTAVVATAATLAVVPTLVGGSASATTATRADTSLSIRAVKPAVAPGKSSTIRGRLAVPGADPAGRNVLLEARTPGTPGFIPVASTTSGTYGKLTLKVTPETTTLYRWRYAGAADADRAVSGVARVRVRVPQHPAVRIRTTLSVRLKQVGPQDQDVVRGKLFARGMPLGGRWVILVSRTPASDGWGFESAARTDGRGRVVFGVEPEGQTAYRLAFLGTPKLRPARSARVVVRTASEVSISAVPGVIDPGGSSTVSGVVTSSGAATPGASVTLLARKVGSSAAWAAEQTGTTAADGTVSFTVAPERSTAYRLRVTHSPGVARGTSPIARVLVRASSSLSIRGRTVGEGYVVDGQLRAAGATRPGRNVTLQAMSPGSTAWEPVGVDVTNGKGRVHFVQARVADTQYRLVYDGEARFLPTVSGTVVS